MRANNFVLAISLASLVIIPACARKQTAAPKAKPAAVAQTKSTASVGTASAGTTSQEIKTTTQVKSARTVAQPAVTRKKGEPAKLLPAADLRTDKEKRLAALLEQYQAEAIGAVEYHEERAKILAEP